MGERGRDNAMHYIYVPFDAYGRAAEILVGLAPGTSVFLRGKLAWKRDPTQQTKGALRVTVWSVTAEDLVATAPLAFAAASDGGATRLLPAPSATGEGRQRGPPFISKLSKKYSGP